MKEAERSHFPSRCFFDLHSALAIVLVPLYASGINLFKVHILTSGVFSSEDKWFLTPATTPQILQIPYCLLILLLVFTHFLLQEVNTEGTRSGLCYGEVKSCKL